jgi:hypothetical protein
MGKPKKVKSMKYNTTATDASDDVDLSPTIFATPEPAPTANLSDGKLSRAQRRKAKKVDVALAQVSPYRECLEQAEICREQARAAARLKRWKAARGLFDTAISLCQRALGVRSAQEDDRQAQEYLNQLTMEISTYSELAKSMERPLMGGSSTASLTSMTNAALSPQGFAPTMPLNAASSSFSNAGKRARIS